MSLLSLGSNRVKSKSSGKSPASLTKPISYFLRWSIVVEEAMSLCCRVSRKLRPSAPARKTIATITDIDLHQMAGPFVLKESVTRGADLVFFGDELFKWRREFNIKPSFIAMRDINRDEEVFSNPADLERSDLLVHWQVSSQERK